MIIFKLAQLLDEKGISQNRLSIGTKIRPGTVNAYYHGFIKHMHPSHLDKMCKFLNCKLEDLIEYIPDKK